MKKKFYDFTLSNIIIVLLAYTFTFTLTLYNLFNEPQISVSGIIFNSLLFLSLLALVVFFGFLPVTLKNGEIRHLKKRIPLNTMFWYIRPNYRLRYDEIIFRDRRIPYERLSKREVRRNEIRVQHFMKYQVFLEENVGLQVYDYGG